MTIRVAIYARYSSELQRDSSIEDQIRMISELAERQGWQVVAPYTDHAISGASMNRPGLKMMMQDAAEGKFDMVVTEGLDRISRDQEHIAGIHKRLNFAGVQIYSLSDGGIVNELHIGLKGTMNQMFLKDLAAKTFRGLKGRAEKGKAAGGKSYGYDTVREFDARGEPIRGERKINLEHAVIVQRIFEEYAAGISPRRIASDLNRDKIPSPRGGTWSSSTITGRRDLSHGTINNELYNGRMVWGKFSNIKNPDTGKPVKRKNPKDEWVITDVPDLQIISDALWAKVKTKQKSLEQKGSALQLKRRPKTLFSYLLKCGCCNGGFSMISAKRYGCSTARNKGSCNNRMTIARTKIENTVLNALQGQLMQPELFKAFSEEYTAHISTLSQRQNQSTELAKAKLEKLASAKANIITAIREGIPAAAVKDELLKIEAEREETEISLLKATPRPIEIKANMAERYREKIINLCADLNQEDTRQEAADLIRNLVEKVTIQPDKYGTQLELTLHGDLAGMLSLASDSEAPQPINLAFNDEVATQLPKDLQYLLTTAEGLSLS